jgi:hypothetical protein
MVVYTSATLVRVSVAFTININVTYQYHYAIEAIV